MNDTIIFYRAQEDQTASVKQVLHDYETASRSVINFNNTNVLFSKVVKSNTRARIVHSFDKREVLSYEKYLGLPTFIGRSQKQPFALYSGSYQRRRY